MVGRFAEKLAAKVKLEEASASTSSKELLFVYQPATVDLLIVTARAAAEFTLYLLKAVIIAVTVCSEAKAQLEFILAVMAETIGRFTRPP